MKWVLHCCVHLWSWRMAWAKAQHGESDAWDSPTIQRPDRDCQIKDNLCRYRLKTAERHSATERLGLSQRSWVQLPVAASFPLPFQRSLDGNSTDCVWSNDIYQVFGPWGTPIHQTPQAVILHTILQLCSCVIMWHRREIAGEKGWERGIWYCSTDTFF